MSIVKYLVTMSMVVVLGSTSNVALSADQNAQQKHSSVAEQGAVKAAPNAGELKAKVDSLTQSVAGFDNKTFKAKEESYRFFNQQLFKYLLGIAILGSAFLAWKMWIKQGRPAKTLYKTKITVIGTFIAGMLIAAVGPKPLSAEDQKKSDIATAIENGTIGQLAQAEVDAERSRRDQATAKAAEDQKKAAESLVAEKAAAEKKQAEAVAAQRAESAKRAEGLAVAIVQNNIKSPASFQLVSTKLHWTGADAKGNPAYIMSVVFDAQNSFGALLRDCVITAFGIEGKEAVYKRELGTQGCKQGMSERELVDIMVTMNGFRG